MTDSTKGAGEKRRRPRYRGTHPRRFEEKYKERDPARFPEEHEKVLAAGRTPAGSHVPVLVAYADRLKGALENDELTALEAFLRDLPACLAPGGRVAILTFHSGEGRLVKKAFKAGLEAGLYVQVADTVVRATPEERRANPRSSSAKLRWAVRAE